VGDGNLRARNSIELLGVRIDDVDMAASLEAIDGFIRSRTPHIVVTADASCVVLARKDAELREIVNSADLVTPDSIGILLAARLNGKPLTERVSGCDMVVHLCERASRLGYRVFLLGAAPGVADAAAEKLRERFPGLDIVGIQHGYFKPEETEAVVSMIRAAEPDLLFVAFGIPLQEKWIRRHMEALGAPVCMGVGGSFDVLSGKVKRAPKWMQRYGLEWVYRLASNPRKIGKVMTLPVFAALVVASKIMRRS
jgi:N-acetylglucosaminyldiphosphoundecaprenol N-acetyl-beta-D-mannosaminyltransferase